MVFISWFEINYMHIRFVRTTTWTEMSDWSLYRQNSPKHIVLFFYFGEQWNNSAGSFSLYHWLNYWSILPSRQNIIGRGRRAPWALFGSPCSPQILLMFFITVMRKKKKRTTQYDYWACDTGNKIQLGWWWLLNFTEDALHSKYTMRINL